MKALSIRQPWAWAILKAGKDVENRDWPTLFRGRFAIHAARGMTKDEYQSAIGFITRAFVANTIKNRRDINKEYQAGPARLTVASGELVMPDWEEIIRGAIVGVAEISGCGMQSASPWFEGLYGFDLKNVIALPEPIPCKGALMFWNVPAAIEKQIQEQLRKGK